MHGIPLARRERSLLPEAPSNALAELESGGLVAVLRLRPEECLQQRVAHHLLVDRGAALGHVRDLAVATGLRLVQQQCRALVARDEEPRGGMRRRRGGGERLVKRSGERSRGAAARRGVAQRGGGRVAIAHEEERLADSGRRQMQEEGGIVLVRG